MPKGLTVEPSGFGTVLSAPPTDYEPPAPPEPIVRREPSGAADPGVDPALAHLIRVLPRVRPQPVSQELVVRNMEAPPIARATVILRDGCFRLAKPREPLVLFTVGVRAFLDEAGYLAIGAADNPAWLSGRVGEPLRWEGQVDPVTDAAITAPINRLCGPGKVVRIGLASSDAAQTNVEDASTAREMSSRYGMTYSAARAEVRSCRTRFNRRWAELRARYGEREPPVELLPGPCMLTPPLPVKVPADCPPGTSFRGSLCIDARGNVVPVPPRRPMG